MFKQCYLETTVVKGVLYLLFESRAQSVVNKEVRHPRQDSKDWFGQNMFAVDSN